FSRQSKAVFERLLSQQLQYYVQATAKQEKEAWESMLLGLLALGTSPVPILDKLFKSSNGLSEEHTKEERRAIDDENVKEIYVLANFSIIIITHLQVRAKFPMPFEKELDMEFEKI